MSRSNVTTSAMSKSSVTWKYSAKERNKIDANVNGKTSDDATKKSPIGYGSPIIGRSMTCRTDGIECKCSLL